MMPAGSPGGSPTDLLTAWQADAVGLAGLRKMANQGFRHQGPGLQRLQEKRQRPADGGKDRGASRQGRSHHSKRVW